MALDADFSIFNECVFIKRLCSNIHLCRLQWNIALWKDVSTFPTGGKGRDLVALNSFFKMGWSLSPVK